MTEKIMKLLTSKDESDNIVGLILFKRIKGATNKGLCDYIRKEWRIDTYILLNKYFYNPHNTSLVYMKMHWKQKISKK